MRHLSQALLAISLLAALILTAQTSAPEIPFTAFPDLLKFPDAIPLGEAAGVATNTRGDVFVYTRTGHPTITIGTARPFAHGGSRLVEFDHMGNFVREIGKDSYGFMDAQQVRVDPQNNIWTVDQMTNMVIEFDPNGRVQLLLGRKAESRTRPGSAADTSRWRTRRRTARRRRPERPLQPANRRRLGWRRQHLCGRWPRQCPHRQVR